MLRFHYKNVTKKPPVFEPVVKKNFLSVRGLGLANQDE